MFIYSPDIDMHVIVYVIVYKDFFLNISCHWSNKGQHYNVFIAETVGDCVSAGC